MTKEKRKIVTSYRPPEHPGFLGEGHIARPVIQVAFEQSDPFILLMDDLLEKKDFSPAGGPHPHGGFETVSLVLEGELAGDTHGLKAGDLEMMTAGSGIVHTETIDRPTKLRLLQLWLNLPKKHRNALPRVQRLTAESVPTVSVNGATAKVFSGSFAGVKSPLLNYTPIVIADVAMQPNAIFSTALPSNFSSFLYVIEGVLSVGGEAQELSSGQVGWLDRYPQLEESELILKSGSDGARAILYAAEPQHHEIVSHGPFIADTMDGIKQLYADYRAGKMTHITNVSPEQKLSY